MQGFCNGADCQTFIVVPGEFGTRMIDPKDIEVRLSPEWLQFVAIHCTDRISTARGSLLRLSECGRCPVG